jgi:hypothetical protein
MFRQDCTCPALLESLSILTRKGLSPSKACLSRQFRFLLTEHWPDPRSLATTNGVSFDVLSSRYLDVSVPWVRFISLCIQDTIPFSDNEISDPGHMDRNRRSRHLRWVAPFGNPRIKVCSQLPTAYRSVPRPSSPLSAKASTECP